MKSQLVPARVCDMHKDALIPQYQALIRPSNLYPPTPRFQVSPFSLYIIFFLLKFKKTQTLVFSVFEDLK